MDPGPYVKNTLQGNAAGKIFRAGVENSGRIRCAECTRMGTSTCPANKPISRLLGGRLVSKRGETVINLAENISNNRAEDK